MAILNSLFVSNLLTTVSYVLCQWYAVFLVCYVLCAILVLCMSIGGGVAKNYFHLSQCSKIYPLNPYSPCTAQYTVQVVWCYPCFPRAVQHSTGARRGPPPCAQLRGPRCRGVRAVSRLQSGGPRTPAHQTLCDAVNIWNNQILSISGCCWAEQRAGWMLTGPDCSSPVIAPWAGAGVTLACCCKM